MENKKEEGSQQDHHAGAPLCSCAPGWLQATASNSTLFSPRSTQTTNKMISKKMGH